MLLSSTCFNLYTHLAAVVRRFPKGTDTIPPCVLVAGLAGWASLGIFSTCHGTENVSFALAFKWSLARESLRVEGSVKLLPVEKCGTKACDQDRPATLGHFLLWCRQ